MNNGITRVLPRLKQRFLPVALAALLSAAPSVLADQDEWPEHARDLGYGHAIYQFYQSDYLHALTLLNVAKERGGITGHGAHPRLLEGGLMLSYGMVHEARTIFEQLLRDQVSAEARNQAWYYLGKVFFLEGEDPAAFDALKKVSAASLLQQDQALYYDYLYLLGQLELRKSGIQNVAAVIASLPETHLARVYLAYNEALQNLETGDAALTIAALNTVKQAFPQRVEPHEADEARALYERIALSLATLHLQRADYAQAMSTLESVRFDSPFTGLALFNFAVSAANQDQYGLALQALQTLQKLPLFTPWLQQVPFAMAYVYEKLGNEPLAFQHYRDAAQHYAAQHAALVQRRESLSEADIMQALAPRGEPSAELALGHEAVQTDAYGRVKSQPRDFTFAMMLAEEGFQLALKELHELYTLRDSLQQWDDKLDSFALILDVRKTQRDAGLLRTRNAMAEQNATQWQTQYLALKQSIENASALEDVHYFMTPEQIDHFEQIQAVYRNLNSLPEADRAEYAERIRRIDAYFRWSLYDSFARNRWLAAKPLRALDQEMEHFVIALDGLEQEMASDDTNVALSQRVQSGHARLDALRAELELTLMQSRDRLLETVRKELREQERDTLAFLTSSRQAQARLADALYVQMNEEETARKAEADGVVKPKAPLMDDQIPHVPDTEVQP